LKFSFGHVWPLFMAVELQNFKIIAVLSSPLALKNQSVRSEQRRKSAKAPSALRVGLKRVCRRRCSFVTYRSGYAPHSRPASKPF
jgi:hypothetical protein